jgi:hypothetical protein
VSRVLWDAIVNRRTISFVFRGHVRTAEPHCYGLSSDGRELLKAYQVAGYSKSAPLPGWRTYEVVKMLEINVGPHFFTDASPSTAWVRRRGP